MGIYLIKTGLSTDFLCHLFHKLSGNLTLTVLYIFKLHNIFETVLSQTYFQGKETINCIKLFKKNIKLIYKQDLEFTMQLSKLRFKSY